jgi:ATP-dependent RNA helicase DeaD
MRGYEAAALHGDIMQNQREKVLERFRLKKTRILVATDVAARGIDVEGLTHVVNFSMPFDVASYIHRIGRTGRAGAKGLAFTFVRPDERRRLDFLRRSVQKQIKSDMKEEEIPTVEQVINVKKKHLLEHLRSELQKLSREETDENKNNSEEQNLAISETAEELKTEEKLSTLQIESIYKKLASKLIKVYPSDELVAALLQLTYGKQLSSQHYGTITPCKMRNSERVNRSSNEKQLRLFVGLGFTDGYGKREIGNYLSSLLHIYPRQVDRIDVADKFSLVSLPVEAARRALEYSRRDKSLPHMHVDQKEERAGQEKRQNYKSRRTPRDTDFSHAKQLRQKSRTQPPKHSDKTSNANLYVY